MQALHILLHNSRHQTSGTKILITKRLIIHILIRSVALLTSGLLAKFDHDF